MERVGASRTPVLLLIVARMGIVLLHHVVVELLLLRREIGMLIIVVRGLEHLGGVRVYILTLSMVPVYARGVMLSTGVGRVLLSGTATIRRMMGLIIIIIIIVIVVVVALHVAVAAVIHMGRR